MFLTYEAMRGIVPDLFFGMPLLADSSLSGCEPSNLFILEDTMGYAFSFHVVRWLSWGRTPICELRRELDSFREFY